MRHIFFTFSYIFFSIKRVFFSKKNFQCKTFFPYKNFFSANNVYFVKNTNILKKNFFLQLSFATNEQPYFWKFFLLKSISYKNDKKYTRSFNFKQEQPSEVLSKNSVQTCSFIKKRLQHRCFHVNIVKFWRTLANGCFCLG